MRTAALFASACAGAVIALSAGAGSAAAATPAPDPAVRLPGHVFVVPGEAVPGQIVKVAGSCPLPAPGAPEPVLSTVTSPAFGALGGLSELGTMAFAGDATLLPNLRSGTYTVEAVCSNGTVSTQFTVTAGAPTPTPAPTPAPHPAAPPVVPPRPVEPSRSTGGVFVVQGQPDPAPAWPWLVGGGLLVALVTGGAACAIEHHRRMSAADDESSTPRAEKTLMDRTPR